MSDPANATLGAATATGRIGDNDCDDPEPDTSGTAALLGTISGDTGSASLTLTGSICAGDDDWAEFTLTGDDESFPPAPRSPPTSRSP